MRLRLWSKLTLLLGLCGLLCLCAAASAQRSFLMNFDTDADGNPIAEGTFIDEQYAGFGAHFIPDPFVFEPNTVSGYFFAFNTDMTATSIDTGDGYDPRLGNVLHAYGLVYQGFGWLSEYGDANFEIKFDKPVTDFSLDFIGDTDGFSSLYAYNPYGQFMKAAGVVSTGDIETVSITPNKDDFIGAIVVTPGWEGDYVAVDNIRFTAVPEPGSLALLVGTGAFGVGLHCRRRKVSGKS
ncbi:MAG TPA: PEP-CTERM sorting domain-containing protein [Chthonomonadaceae bacterium]|nr:PEP-CTERM sorting domain-containing protein [Chthonomonadaceae bacterium]